MNKIRVSGLAAFALLILGVPVFGHHGTAVSYDQDKVVTVKGIVKEFRY